MNLQKIEAGIKLVLEGLECDMKDPNFIDTPARVARAYRQIFNSPERGWNSFEEPFTDIVLMRGHQIYTLCPHHLLPVKMKVYLAYKPKGHVLGLSKLARLCHEVNKKPMLQEAFTFKLPELLCQLTNSEDAACLVEGDHGCMQMRGVKSHADTVTFTFFGCFNSEPWQSRFFTLLGRKF